MLNIIRGENLKMKRSGTRKNLFIMPMLIGLILIVFSRYHLEKGGFNWWYVLMLPMTAGVIGIGFVEKERKKLDYKGIDGTGICLRKVWLSKIITASAYFILSNIIMFALIEFGTIIFNGQTTDISTGEALLSLIMWIIGYMWMIPFIMMVCVLTGSVGGYIMTFGGLASGLLTDLKNWWWINPFSWCSRAQISIIKVMPNGLNAEEGSIFVNYGDVFLASVLSIMFFILCTWISIRTMEWRRQHG